MTNPMTAQDITPEQVAAGFDCFCSRIGGSDDMTAHEIMAHVEAIYLAMRSKDHSIAVDDVRERVAKAIAFQHYSKATVALGRPAPKTLPESYNWSKHLGDADAAITAIGSQSK